MFATISHTIGFCHYLSLQVIGAEHRLLDFEVFDLGKRNAEFLKHVVAFVVLENQLQTGTTQSNGRVNRQACRKACGKPWFANAVRRGMK